MLQATDNIRQNLSILEMGVPEVLDVVCLLLWAAQLLYIVGSDGTRPASAPLV